MRSLLSRLWADDLGGIISAEYVMVMGVVTGGAVAGASLVRNSVTAGFEKLGASIAATVPDPEYVRRAVQPPPVLTARVATAEPAYLFVAPAP